MTAGEQATLATIRELEKVLLGLENGTLDVETCMFARGIAETTPPEALERTWAYTGATTYQFTVKLVNGPVFELREPV